MTGKPSAVWRVTLAGDDVPGATGQTFIGLKAEHHFRSQAYGSGDAGQDERPYEGSYVLLPHDATFRPERRLSGPKVQGPETAVVVGDGEIDCDEHGRILVRFHWDLEEANSMRVRVSQNWAAKGWGGMVIPRIGMEVIVEHLRGDPDKPIVTGCVYNGKNTPPYNLPKHKTRSTFKTNTHQGKGFNELRFEDENEREEIFVHAQKDMNTEVENERSILIANDHIEFNGENKITKTVMDEKNVIDQNHRVDVGGNSTSTINGNFSIAVGHSSSARVPHIKSGQVLKDFAHHRNDFSSLSNASLGEGNFTLNIAKDRRERIGGISSEVVEKSKSVASGKDVMLSAAEQFAINAGKIIQLCCGASKIEMHPDGTIKIDGVHIIINGNRVDIN